MLSAFVPTSLHWRYAGDCIKGPAIRRLLFTTSLLCSGWRQSAQESSVKIHRIKKSGFNKTQAHTGTVTLIQRFGSALNLNVHFHMLFIDGVYQEKPYERVKVHPVNAPTARDLNALVATIIQRVARRLERQG